MYIKKSPKRVSIKGYKKNDCTIRAIGNVLGISYDLSRKILQTGDFDGINFYYKNTLKKKSEFIKESNVEKICEALSCRTEDLYGETPVKFNDFALTHNDGIYLILSKGHLSTIINGNIVDKWDCSNEVVSKVYKVDLKRSIERITPLAIFYKLNTSKHICQLS